MRKPRFGAPRRRSPSRSTRSGARRRRRSPAPLRRRAGPAPWRAVTPRSSAHSSRCLVLVAALPVIDRIRARPRVGEDRVERLVDRVSQHERAAHHRDAEDDRDRGQDRSQLPAEKTSELCADHALRDLVIVARIVLPRAPRKLADDRPVGEEQDAVGDRRGLRVVRDHHHRLTEPSSTSRSSSRISALVFESRFPVGSSANTTVGCETSARAIATRCCWPPESSDGRWLSRVAARRDHQILEERRVGLLAGDREREKDVLLGRQHRQQVEELEDEADVLAPKQGHPACRTGCRRPRRRS